MAGWVAGIALALVVGLAGGIAAGEAKARKEISADCRYSGGFSVSRTGFTCQVIQRGKQEDVQ